MIYSSKKIGMILAEQHIIFCINSFEHGAYAYTICKQSSLKDFNDELIGQERPWHEICAQCYTTPTKINFSEMDYG